MVKNNIEIDVKIKCIEQGKTQAKVAEEIDEIYDDVDKEDIVLDYIDQCNTIFRKFGVEPHVPDYPDSMKPFPGRKIWKDT